MSRRVVVTGMGCVSPCGNTAADTWSAMCEPRSGIGPLTRFSDPRLKIRAIGEVSDLNVTEKLHPKLVKRTGLFMQYALIAASEALGQAGYDREAGDWPAFERFGCSVASGIGGFPEIVEEAYRCRDEGPHRVSPLFVPQALNNLAAGQIAIRFGAGGPSLCHATACAAGNHALGAAARLVRLGEADVMLAGGAEAAICPLAIGGFSNMRALSTRAEALSTACRPFDRDRDGFVMGEGAGLLVLEGLEHARARGATIYAELLGSAETTDAYHITAPSPDGEGAARCMRLALHNAGLAVTDVDYINAHGTSTPLNDRTETAAIRSVFGAHADTLMVSSTKGVTGHLLGAAGGVEAIACVQALYTGTVPMTAHLQTADPECDLDYVADGSRAAYPTVALSNGFGFGGTNGVVVFRRWEER
jgi:3-oxoacyl-[acyl-carrier-protein] synthase II